MEKNKVLATVDGREITQADLDTLFSSLPPQTSGQFASEEGKQRLLQELVNQELFYLNAVDSGIDKEEEFQKQFEKTKTNLLKQYAVGKLIASIAVGEEDVKEFYNMNKASFDEPKSVKASHILIDDELAAHKVLKELNDGLSFEDAASKYSNCPSKAQGGDLGFFTKGRMVPEFENVAFALEINKISHPVKTQFGFHIIKVTEKKEGTSKSLDEVRDMIRQHLTGNRQQDIYYAKVDELAKKYEVKINK